MNRDTIKYIIDLLIQDPELSSYIFYGQKSLAPPDVKIIITPSSFFNDDTFGTVSSLPVAPFQILNDVPILFGKASVKKNGDGIICSEADIIASSFFLLSRYEEIVKPDARDQYGRFLAGNSVIYQQGFGVRPLVDEYGAMLRDWLREAGVKVDQERKGFAGIYLTHDVDTPFRYERLRSSIKRIIYNILRRGEVSRNPLGKYILLDKDEYFTFPDIIKYDKILNDVKKNVPMKSIYFFIPSGTGKNKKYYNFFSWKNKRLIKLLINSGAEIGLHVSHEAGIDPSEIKNEAEKLSKLIPSYRGISRHHYLRWREPEHYIEMEKAGITDDFSMSYADSIGFRVGTCCPYRFINPKTQELTNLVIHPLEIMDATLTFSLYMNLNYKNALSLSKNVIYQVYKHYGELVLLWHNTTFAIDKSQISFYKDLIGYIIELLRDS